MKHRTLLFLAVAVLAFAGLVVAQTPSDTASQPAQTASGRVISSTPTQIVIEDASGVRRTYVVDSTSTVPSGLATGARVDIEFHPLEGGRFHTSRVTLLPAETTDTAVTQPAPTQVTPTTPTPMADTTTRTTTETSRPMDTTSSATTTDTSRPVTDTTTPADTTTADTSGSTDRRMPATASPLPLVGLIGLGSLAGGLAARALRRR